MVHMSRTIPKTCFFNFFNFQKNSFNYYFPFFEIYCGKQYYMQLTISPELMVYKKKLDFLR